MSLESALQTLKAAGDPTRVRLLALLSAGEATVGELQQILEQSQPRVSRHLRLLDEAGLVAKFRDGHWIYYRLATTAVAKGFTQQVTGLIGGDDRTLSDDAAALARVKRERERDVYASPERPLPGSGFSSGRPDVAQVASVLDELVGEGRLGSVLDVGSGAGGLLCLLGARAAEVVGVDCSKRMRLLSRSRVHQSGLTNCSVRNGELHALPFDDDTFDLVILDEVLNGTHERRDGLREARRVLRRDGRLVIIDRVQPAARQLEAAGGAHPLIENQLTAQLGEQGFRIASRAWLPGRVMEFALFLALPEAEQLRTGTDD